MTRSVEKEETLLGVGHVLSGTGPTREIGWL